MVAKVRKSVAVSKQAAQKFDVEIFNLSKVHESQDISMSLKNIDHLKKTLRLLCLKTQSVPRCKHFSSQLQKPTSLCCKWHKSLVVLR